MVMRYHGGGVGHLGMRFDPAIYEGPGQAEDAESLPDSPIPEPRAAVNKAAVNEAVDSDSSKSDGEDFIHEQREMTDESEEEQDGQEEEQEGLDVQGKQELARGEGDEDIVTITEDDPRLYGFDEA
jgi:hypothetical protein